MDHYQLLQQKGGRIVEPAGILASKNWIFVAALVTAVGIWKILRDIRKGRALPFSDILLGFTSSMLGGTLFFLIALGANVNIFWCAAAAMSGAWLGVSAFRVGESELRKRAGLDRRRNDSDK